VVEERIGGHGQTLREHRATPKPARLVGVGSRPARRTVGGTPREAPVFERFTHRARRVVVFAQEEARLLDHNYIGTEHILLGLTSPTSPTRTKADRVPP
jgi:hypothetical protein